MHTDFERIRQIFLAVVEQPSAQWEALLDEACGNDPELRQQVALLLDAHGESEGILDRQGAGRVPTGVYEPLSERPGTMIGPYKLLQQIGEGGMGTVFMAEQTQPVQRKVAVKVIKAGMDSRQVIARFEAERQALAMMDHVNIARVLDAGATASGRPYFVMELVKGVPLTRYCDEHHLTPRQRLELFIPICQAIQHAHQKGIIHRDIKPSNVLVAMYDDRPVPKVIDFGVAKATGQQLTESTLHTGFGDVVGTLEYMSPEQASFNQLDVDTRSDIYSLGVLLYELLTGSPPFSKKELEKAGMMEMLRVIREQEPSKPSTKLSSSDALPTLSANRGTEPARLTRLVRGELDWIVMKALEKDRSRRYETANGFAMDVQRYLADEPVHACPPSAKYRLRKFARRNKALFTTIGLVSAALFIGIAVSVSQAIRATLAEERATDNANKAETQRGIAVTNERAARDNELLAKRRYYAAQMNLAVRAWEEGDVTRVLELLETQRPRFGEDDPRAFEWYALWQLCYQQLRFSVQAKTGAAYSVAYSPDSRVIALGSSDGTVKLLDAGDGREIRTLRSAGRSQRGAVAFSHDGKLLAQSAGPTEDEVTLWNMSTGEQAFVLSGTGKAYALAFSADRRTLATATNDGTVCLWDIATGVLKDKWETQIVTAIGFSPDGKWLATSSSAYQKNTKATLFWDVTVVPARITREIPARGDTLAFSADGKQFVVGTASAFVVIDTQTWKQIPSKRGPWGHGRSLAFVPGRNTVAVGVQTHSVKLVDLKTGDATTLPHQSILRSLAVAPDGKSLVAIGGNARLQVWNLGPATNTDVIDIRGDFGSVALSPDGKTLAVGMSGMVKLFDAASGALKLELKGHPLAVQSMAFLRDGETLIAGSCRWSEPGDFKLWDLRTGKERIPSPEFTTTALAVALDRDERTLAVGGPHSDLSLFDVRTAQRLAVVKAPNLTNLTYSPDGKLLISAGALGKITLRDPATGAERLTFGPDNASFTSALACSKDGKLLASGNALGLVCLWELPSGRLRSTFRGNTTAVQSVAFFPDGNTLVTSNEAGEVKLWDIVTGQERITFRLGVRAAVSFDGKILAAGKDGKVRLLRVATTPEALARKNELDPDDPEGPLAQLDSGNRLWATGERREAEKAYRRANERLRTLVDQSPQEISYGYELVRSALSLRLLLEDRGATAEAEEIWKQAQASYQNLSSDEVIALARHTYAIGDLLRKAGAPDTAFRAYALAIELKPDDPSVWFHRGYAYGERKQVEQALADYAKTVELNPKLSGAWNNRGVIYEGLGQLDQALAAFSRAVEIEPKAVLSWHNRARLYARQKQWNEAIADYSKAVELAPNDMEIRYNRAVAYHNIKQFDLAIADYSLVLERDPAHAATRDNRGRLYSQQRKWDQAVSDFSKIIELKPDYADAWYNRGRARAELQQWDKALSDYSRTVQLDAQHRAAWNGRGLVLEKLNRLDEAVKDFSQAIHIKPDDLVVWHNRGRTYAQLKQWDKANADFTQAAKLGEKDPVVWLSLGQTYADFGRWEESERHYSRAIELKPELVEAWHRRAWLRAGLKRWDEALSDLDKVLELSPATERWLAHKDRGACLHELGRGDDAVAELSRAIEQAREPQRAGDCYRLRGLVNQSRKRYPEARADYQKALELEPKSHEGLNGLAWLLATCADDKLRDPKRAVELAKKAVAIAPEAGTLWNTLGVAHYRAGDSIAAIAALEKSLELGQDYAGFDYLFLAMAQARRDDAKQARQSYDRALEWAEKNQEAMAKSVVLPEEFRRFREEAEELLKLKKN